MEELPFQLVFWHWWSLAFVLLIVELLASGFFFLWIAIAAAVVGLITFVFPELPVVLQFLLLGTLSIVSTLVWMRHDKRHPPTTDEPSLNQRGDEYIGRTFTLEQAIIHGYGKIRVDDSIWKIEGDEVPAGTQVKVVGIDSMVLQVERVQD